MPSLDATMSEEVDSPKEKVHPKTGIGVYDRR